MAASDYQGFEAPDDTVIWRYVPLARYHELLEGRLYFSAAHQFDDSFEGAITSAQEAWRTQQIAGVFPGDPDGQRFARNGLSSAFADLRRMTKINCWHARPAENLAMWERYVRGAPGVAVASSVSALKRAIEPFRLRREFGEEPIVVGAVKYIDYASEEMLDTSMLGVFLYKRAEYSDEAEIRAILSLRMTSEFGVEIPADGVVVTIDPAALIREVRAWPTAGSDDLAALAGATRAAGVTGHVRPSTLAARPTY